MEADGDRNLEAGFQFQTAADLFFASRGNSKLSDRIPSNGNDGGEDTSVYDSVFNAAVAFRQAGRHDLAEKFYRKAVTLQSSACFFMILSYA